MNDLFILIDDKTDYQEILGVYDDYLKAEEDYYNSKKYSIYDDLKILGVDKNVYYGKKTIMIIKQ